MATWRVWIGEAGFSSATWKSYVVTASDQKKAVREVYKLITGVDRAPLPSWILWNVREVELADSG